MTLPTNLLKATGEVGEEKKYYSLPSKEYLLNNFGGRMEKSLLFSTLQTRPIKQFLGGGEKNIADHANNMG